jgi:hypothetical protein
MDFEGADVLVPIDGAFFEETISSAAVRRSKVLSGDRCPEVDPARPEFR